MRYVENELVSSLVELLRSPYIKIQCQVPFYSSSFVPFSLSSDSF